MQITGLGWVNMNLWMGVKVRRPLWQGAHFLEPGENCAHKIPGFDCADSLVANMVKNVAAMW